VTAVEARQGEGQKGRKRLGQQPSHVTSGSARYTGCVVQACVAVLPEIHSALQILQWIGNQRTMNAASHLDEKKSESGRLTPKALKLGQATESLRISGPGYSASSPASGQSIVRWLLYETKCGAAGTTDLRYVSKSWSKYIAKCKLRKVSDRTRT
jgi:hypothetical protein